MQVTVARPEDDGPISWGRLGWGTLLSVIAGMVATGILFAAASAAGLVDARVVLPTVIGSGPLNLAAVWAATVAAVVGASLLLAVLAVTTRRAVGVFRVVATVLAVASLSLPLTVAGPTAGMRLTMAAMHVVVWVVCVGLLATLARREVR